jgi:hypothetical protein
MLLRRDCLPCFLCWGGGGAIVCWFDGWIATASGSKQRGSEFSPQIRTEICRHWTVVPREWSCGMIEHLSDPSQTRSSCDREGDSLWQHGFLRRLQFLPTYITNHPESIMSKLLSRVSWSSFVKVSQRSWTSHVNDQHIKLKLIKYCVICNGHYSWIYIRFSSTRMISARNAASDPL